MYFSAPVYHGTQFENCYRDHKPCTQAHTAQDQDHGHGTQLKTTRVGSGLLQVPRPLCLAPFQLAPQFSHPPSVFFFPALNQYLLGMSTRVY